MTDLHTRFRTLDSLSTPDLWYDIEERAMAMQPARRSNPWVLVAVVLLLVLAIGGAVLIGSGIVKLPVSVENSANPSASAQESSAASSSPVAPVPASWTATGDLIEARTNHTATQLLNGRVLVAGGIGVETAEFVTNFLASAELYDPTTGQWTATGSMADMRVGHAAVLLPDGRVLVVGGGSSSDGDGGPLSSAELYDPATGTWTPTGSTAAEGPGRTATLMGNGTVLVVGGSVDLQPIRFAELYDPDTGQWTRTADMAASRDNHTATLLLDGRVLVAGGDSAETYDPASGQWIATAAMPAPTIGHTATRLLDGRVLLAGSAGGTDASASADLYDPSSGQWAATGAMGEGRISHKATLLPGGRVLVIGGTNSVIDAGVLKASAELYDSATGSWTATASMAIARTGHSVTLLSDGSVLVVGGTDGSGPLTSAERYDPGTEA